MNRTPPGKIQVREPEKLTPREELFVLRLVALGNKTEAYIAAGYRVKNRDVAGSLAGRLLRNERVRRAYDAERAAVLKRAEIDADGCFRRLRCIAAFDILDLYDTETEQPKRLSDLPPDVRCVIKRIDKDGTIHLHDVMRALELIAEAGGLIRRKVDASVALFDHAGFLQELEDRRAARPSENGGPEGRGSHRGRSNAA